MALLLEVLEVNDVPLDEGSDDHLPLDRRVARLLRVDEVAQELSCLPMRPLLPSLEDDEDLRG